MEGFSPSDVAKIQRRMRRFNSSGTSEQFSPPQNTPPTIPTVDINRGPIYNPQPSKPQSIAAIERQFKEMEIKEKIAMVPIADNIVTILKQFQVEHVQNLIYALQKFGVALDSSDTGTGKTYAAIAVAACLGLDVIVICPKPVIPSWHNVCDILEVDQIMIVNYEALRGGKYFVTLGDYLDDERIDCPYINFIREDVLDPMTLEPILNANGSTKSKVVDIEWDIPDNTLVIFDEAHNGKNGLNNSIPTVNSKMMINSRQQFNPQRNTFGLFLSATITDKLENFDVIGYLLGLFPSYSKKSYKQFLNKLPDDPTERIAAIHNLLYPERASRMNIRKIKQLTGDSQFKKNDVQAKTYTLDAAAAAEIEVAHQAIRVAMIALRTRQLVDGQHPLVVILRARQRIELLKIPIFIEEANDYLNDGRSVTIFVNFNETMDTIAKKLISSGVPPDDFDYIRGGQSGEDREEIVQSFQTDQIRLLICNIEAGGVGISLHDLTGVFPRASLISPTWKAIHLKQSLGRGYRADAKSDMVQRIIYIKSEDGQPGIEQQMCDNMNAKLKNIALLNDGDLDDYQAV
jgi:Mimiviridae putative ATP-dependent RNA helicase